MSDAKDGAALRPGKCVGASSAGGGGCRDGSDKDAKGAPRGLTPARYCTSREPARGAAALKMGEDGFSRGLIAEGFCNNAGGGLATAVVVEAIDDSRWSRRKSSARTEMKPHFGHTQSC
jgi:hypothetical protein